MSQQEKGQGEPSMEEILASIRRIISDDDKDEEPAAEEAAAPAAEPEAAAPAPSPETPAPPVEKPVVAAPTDSPAVESPVVAAVDAPTPAAIDDVSAPEIIQPVDTPPVEGAEELELTEVIEEDSPTAPVAEKPAAAAPKPASVNTAKPNETLAEDGRKAFLKETLGVPAVVSGEGGESDFVGLVSPPIREISTNTLAELAGAIHARGFVLGNVSMTLEDLIRDLMRPHLKDWLDKNLPGIVERMVRAEIERMASEAEARKDLI